MGSSGELAGDACTDPGDPRRVVLTDGAAVDGVGVVELLDGTVVDAGELVDVCGVTVDVVVAGDVLELAAGGTVVAGVVVVLLGGVVVGHGLVLSVVVVGG